MKSKRFLFLASLLLMSFLLHVGFNQTVVMAQYPVHNLTTRLGYPTIQAAIDANETLSGHTLLVDEGVYFENVIVNKSVSLIGEDRDRTIINGNQSVQDNFAFFIDRTSGVVVEGFTMQNCKVGVFSAVSDYTRISNNKMVNCSWEGVWVDNSHHNFLDRNLINTSYRGVLIDGQGESGSNIVYFNILDNNSMAAIEVDNSVNNSVLSNLITQNSIGIDMSFAAYSNLIIANTLQDNAEGLFLSGATETFYHNNFINDSVNVDNSPNSKLDNGYPSGGNYWSDYNGTDTLSGPYQNETGSDGIGDTPYINANYRDNYPLMALYPSSENMTMESWDLYYKIFKNMSDLAGALSNLDAENKNLTSAYATLLSNYSNLQETSSNLNMTYLATLTQLNNTKNGMYSFIAATVVLAVVASLLAVHRKRK